MENFKSHHSDWIVMSQTSPNQSFFEGPYEVQYDIINIINISLSFFDRKSLSTQF